MIKFVETVHFAGDAQQDALMQMDRHVGMRQHEGWDMDPGQGTFGNDDNGLWAEFHWIRAQEKKN